jgi:hypothetical protein
VPPNAFRSPRATRLLCRAALALALNAVPATAVAAGAQARPAVAHAAQSEQRAQARAERKLQRQARKQQRQTQRSARQAERSTRQAEREQRQATRAAERAQRSGAADLSDETPTQSETAPAEKTEGPKAAPEAQPTGVSHRLCTLTATPSSSQVVTGEAVKVTGKLTCPSPADTGEQEVTVYARQAASGQAAASIAGTATTAADGGYELQSAALSARTVFLVRAASVRHAARAVVLVDGGVSLQGPAANASALPMGAGKGAGGHPKQTFTGTIEPAQAGRQVALRVRYAEGEWRTVAFARTDAEGHFSFSHRFRSAGDVSVIAVARPRGTQRSESPPLTYTIVAGHGAAPTVQSAAPTPIPTPAPVSPVAPVASTPPAAGDPATPPSPSGAPAS